MKAKEFDSFNIEEKLNDFLKDKTPDQIIHCLYTSSSTQYSTSRSLIIIYHPESNMSSYINSQE